MPTYERDSLSIYFEDNERDAPAIVMSHGFLMDHEMFAAQVTALGDEFRCVTWDQRGHGATESGGPFTYWDSAEDVLALMAHLELPHAFLVGMSQGGYLSLRAALLAPDRVTALGLIDTQATPEDPRLRPGYEMLLQRWRDGSSDALLASVASIIIGEGLDSAPWIEKWSRRPTESVNDIYGALMEREDITDRIGQIGCPALVIHGEADAAISVDRAEALCAGLRRCDGLIRIPGATHASNISHPGVVNEALRDFARRYSA